ncbi:MAG: 2-phospho-L-lactate transferase [Anaerolineales bacterium]|nr:2-phospho-L-lactate transferase [Anaerolineales bacterium]
MKVVALAGGVGGARLADGLRRQLPTGELTVVVNTADDFEHLGLRISPDLDTVTYTLAGLENPETGWGRADETWSFLEALERLGGPTWFRLGDRDLAVHMERTALLASGLPLSEVTRRIAAGLGVRPAVLPMSDDPVRTVVCTDAGELPFQEYFVARRCQPVVRSFRFEGVEAARPTSGVVEALIPAPIVILGPSNPWVSLDPILAVPGVRELLHGKTVVGVSPLVGGRALKGPAAKMALELGLPATPLTVAAHFHSILSGFVVDQVDASLADSIERMGVRTLVTNTIMRDGDSRAALASDVLRLAEAVAAGSASP